jgi:ABC-type cobalamin/Fe3+-siderophores transport system ATPase subunit
MFLSQFLKRTFATTRTLRYTSRFLSTNWNGRVGTVVASAVVLYTSGDYDVNKFRRMISINAPKGQVKFSSPKEFCTLMKEVEKRTALDELDDTTVQTCLKVASILDKFDARFVGMEHVKKLLLEQLITGLLQLNKKSNGEACESLSHFTIVGPAGVGKTTLAKEIAPLYYAAGITAKEGIVILESKDLIAGFVGGTASLATESLNKGKDMVVFIDEAHLLRKSGYLQDFLQVLLPFMTQNPNTVVIFAGYAKEIEELLSMDPGLKSRFQEQIVLNGYVAAEMNLIFQQMMKENDFDITEDVKRGLTTYFNSNMHLFPQFARDVQTLVKTCWKAHGANSTHIPSKVLRLIDLKDFKEACDMYLKSATNNKRRW